MKLRLAMGGDTQICVDCNTLNSLRLLLEICHIFFSSRVQLPFSDQFSRSVAKLFQSDVPSDHPTRHSTLHDALHNLPRIPIFGRGDIPHSMSVHDLLHSGKTIVPNLAETRPTICQLMKASRQQRNIQQNFLIHLTARQFSFQKLLKLGRTLGSETNGGGVWRIFFLKSDRQVHVGAEI